MGSEISGAVSGVTTPGASRLQASQSQERSTTMQRLQKGFNHKHRTCPIHQTNTEAYKKAHGSKKRAPAGIREAKVEVDKDELSKLMSVGTELAKEIQEIKRNWVPRSDNKNKENKENDQNKDKDKKPRNRGRKKSVNEVDAEESAPTSTTDAP